MNYIDSMRYSALMMHTYYIFVTLATPIRMILISNIFVTSERFIRNDSLAVIHWRAIISHNSLPTRSVKLHVWVWRLLRPTHIQEYSSSTVQSMASWVRGLSKYMQIARSLFSYFSWIVKVQMLPIQHNTMIHFRVGKLIDYSVVSHLLQVSDFACVSYIFICIIKPQYTVFESELRVLLKLRSSNVTTICFICV